MERIAFEYRKDEPFRVVKDNCIGTIRTMEGGGVSKYIMEVKRIGNLFGDDKGTGFAGNVWDKKGLCPTLTTMMGGYREPMITETKAIRMARTDEGKALRKQYENHEIFHGFNEHREMELREDGLSNTISTVQKDTLVCSKQIVAMRGRNPDNPSDRTAGSPTEQRLEPNSQGICNTLTSVQKDNMVMEQNPIIICDPHNLMPEMVETEVRYRIRKLTPRETWRLMDFSDEDFDKAQAVNSQTQLYRQSGNSICVNVLVAIFGQMIPGKEREYDKRQNKKLHRLSETVLQDKES